MEAPQNFWVPFNISATAEADDFKFGTQLGFAKARHEITPRGTSGRGYGLGKIPKILESPFIISATATSNLVRNLGLPRHIIKLHQYEKVGVALG